MFGLLCSLAITPVIRLVAFRLGALDIPGGRKIHTQPTPRLGGLAIFLSLGISLWLEGFLKNGQQIVVLGEVVRTEALALAATAVTALGVLDDIFSLRPRHKLAVEI